MLNQRDTGQRPQCASGGYDCPARAAMPHSEGACSCCLQKGLACVGPDPESGLMSLIEAFNREGGGCRLPEAMDFILTMAALQGPEFQIQLQII